MISREKIIRQIAAGGFIASAVLGLSSCADQEKNHNSNNYHTSISADYIKDSGSDSHPAEIETQPIIIDLPPPTALPVPTETPMAPREIILRPHQKVAVAENLIDFQKWEINIAGLQNDHLLYLHGFNRQGQQIWKIHVSHDEGRNYIDVTVFPEVGDNDWLGAFSPNQLPEKITIELENGTIKAENDLIIRCWTQAEGEHWNSFGVDIDAWKQTTTITAELAAGQSSLTLR